MRRSTKHRRGLVITSLAALFVFGSVVCSHAGEPDPKSYWDVKDIRPGMKGVGQTVMVGTKLEEFQAEVLGVMRDVNPGRDMVLCRLTGCNLEHAGIIQGMSGSPIYIDGKLLGAVAFAWEFAKDPIAGVTPFSQMIQYVRSNDRRITAESRDKSARGQFHAARMPVSPWIEGLGGDAPEGLGTSTQPIPVSGGGAGNMTPIVTPLAASGFSPRALSLLSDRLRPIGMAPMAGGAAPERIIKEEGNRPLVPGRAVEHRPGPRRLRPLGDRHGHPCGRGSGLRIRPSHVQPGRLRVADDDRIHPYRVPASERQHEDGVAAQDRRRDRYRRQHERRRPPRRQARHDADGRTRQDQPLFRLPDVQGPDRAGADAAADLDHVRPDQCGGHRREPARRADRQAQRHDPPERPRADHAGGHLQRRTVHRPDGPLRPVQPAGLDREHPGPKHDGAGPHRVDRLRRPDRARA